MYTMNTVSTRSPWHSPVPYLFGGLAAMLGLIAFALLILACSYWKLSGYLQNSRDRDLEVGEGHGCDEIKPKYTMKCKDNIDIVVIMAGEENPTFLATPISCGAASVKCDCSGEEASVKVDDEGEGGKMEAGSMERHQETSI